MNLDQDRTRLAPKVVTRQPHAPVGTRTSYEVDPWDEVGIDEEARSLLLRGRTLEDDGDVEGALQAYDRALAAPEHHLRPADTSETLYHSGVCAPRLGDVRRAWDAYLACARVLPQGDLAGDVRDMPSEAGLLQVTHPSTLPGEADVAGAEVAKAFDDAVEGARRCLLGGAPPTYAAAVRVHPVFAGLVVLAAQGGLDAELLQASEALSQRVAQPFVERHGLRRRDPEDQVCRGAIASEALAGLCATVAERERGKRRGRELPRSGSASMTRGDHH